jgi:hypothetical protein
MSLCLVTLTASGLLISGDGRAVVENDFGQSIIVTNNMKKLFVVNNSVVFASGMYKPNMEVLDMLYEIEDKVKDSYITKVCREVFDKWKSNSEVQTWINENQSGINERERKSAIPICLDLFTYKEKSYYSTTFSPENNFEPRQHQIRFAQVLIKGINREKAVELLKQNRTLNKTLKSEVIRFSNIYELMEQNYIDVGGHITFFLKDGNELRCLNE